MNILRNYIYWFLTFILICLIGISNVFALENGGSIRFYDNNGSSLSYVTTDYYSTPDYSSATFTTTANSYGGGVMIQLPTPLIQNHIYTLFINVAAANMGGFTKPSTKNCIGVGNGYTDTINSYINCSITPKYTQESGVTADKRNGLYFTFIANTNASYVLVAYTSQNTCTNCEQISYGYNISDGGDTSGLSQTQVNNIINQQTTTIQNDIYDMQQAVAGSIDNMTDELNKNFNNCYINLFNKNDTFRLGYIDANGNYNSDSQTALFDNISVDSNTNYIIGFKENIRSVNVIYYNGNTFISRGSPTFNVSSFSFKTPSNANKISIQISYQTGTTMTSSIINSLNIQLEKGTALHNYSAYNEEVCINRLDEQTNAINGLNDSINNDDIDNSDYGSFFSNFNTDTFGLTSIITAPLNLIQSLSSSTCNDLELPLPYLNNKKLILPCMTSIYSQYFGTFFTIYQTITFGIVAYWVCVRIFNQVKDFKNPEHDEIEVLDL